MIEKNLKNGAYVVVKDKDGEYQIFSPHKCSYGGYRSSGWNSSADEAKQYIGNYDGYEENLDEYAKKEGWEVVEIFYGQQPDFKEGDNVKVLETGEVGEVSGVGSVFVNVDIGNVIHHYTPTQLAHAEDEPEETITHDKLKKKIANALAECAFGAIDRDDIQKMSDELSKDIDSLQDLKIKK